MDTSNIYVRVHESTDDDEIRNTWTECVLGFLHYLTRITNGKFVRIIYSITTNKSQRWLCANVAPFSIKCEHKTLGAHVSAHLIHSPRNPALKSKRWRERQQMIIMHRGILKCTLSNWKIWRSVRWSIGGSAACACISPSHRHILFNYSSIQHVHRNRN